MAEACIGQSVAPLPAWEQTAQERYWKGQELTPPSLRHSPLLLPAHTGHSN
jgi:hypothetical protein